LGFLLTANIRIPVIVPRHGPDQQLPVGKSGSLFPEKPFPQVLVDPHDPESLLCKSLDALGADPTGRPCDNYCFHRATGIAAPSDVAKHETTQIWPDAQIIPCIFFFWANSHELTSFFPVLENPPLLPEKVPPLKILFDTVRLG